MSRTPKTAPATDSPPSSGPAVELTVTKSAASKLVGYPTGIPWTDFLRTVLAIGEQVPDGAEAVAAIRYGTLTVTWPDRTA